jgi:hypothetical protein
MMIASPGTILAALYRERFFQNGRRIALNHLTLPIAWSYSGPAPTGGPPGGRCRNEIDANAPIHEPAAAKAT